jgi:hypothetical protein
MLIILSFSVRFFAHLTTLKWRSAATKLSQNFFSRGLTCCIRFDRVENASSHVSTYARCDLNTVTSVVSKPVVEITGVFTTLVEKKILEIYNKKFIVIFV